jgi:DNA-binding transcriptional LysR family regulator
LINREGIMNITIRQLEIFLAIAEEQNVTRASANLLVSQSAASMSLRELETQLKGPLFDRIGRKLLLNDRGQTLYPKARNIISRLEELEALFTTEGGTYSGHLRIAASSTIGNYILPDILGQFLQSYPQVDLKLEVGNTDQVVRSVKNNRSDMGFIEGPCLDKDMDIIPWRDDQLMIFTHPQHPLARKSTVSMDCLKREYWILREKGSGTREVFERAWKEHICDIRIKMELGHSEAIKHAVLHNLGISCLSRRVLEDNLKTGRLKALSTPELDLGRQLFVITHREKHLTPLLKAFSNHCRIHQRKQHIS